ncbi:SUKH-3 domain-containing protein [Micromonospora siamensis]|uniref:SUKH-3 immunity protein n=1 Tax=Micromonospora siamensis TaxID=299152 RepID=A0A1C5HNQ0_9ACTN|nr:SUKH-3 domain-containing protein [Micromonospora siamensis]SCG47615.1 SUKH-3 immunity protein [Micromonospora siamensis]
MSRFSPEVEAVLRQAGWFPQRRIDLGAWQISMREFSWHAAATRFLQEFGGIRVEVSGPGVSCARVPFEFDPELAVGEEERFAEFSEVFGRRFFPVGELGQGEFFLAIDDEAVLYYLSARLFRLGQVDSALACLASGVAAERLDPPAANGA